MKIILLPNWSIVGVTRDGRLISRRNDELSIVPAAKLVEPSSGMTFFFKSGEITPGYSTVRRKGTAAQDELMRLRHSLRLVEGMPEVKEAEIT